MAKPQEERPVLHTKKHIARLERERQQTRLILFSFIGIMVAVVFLVVYGYVYIKYLREREAVAKVGNVGIPISYWQARVRMERTQLINQDIQYQQYAQYFGMDTSSQVQQIESQLNAPTTLGQTVINNLIDEELVRQEAAKRGITVSQAEVDKAIQSAFGYYPNGTPTPTITPTEVITPTLSSQTLTLVTITPTPTIVPTATETLIPTFTPTPLQSPTAPPQATNTATSVPTATFTPGPTDTPYPTSTPYTLQGFQDSYNKSLQSFEKLGLTEAQIRGIFEVNLLRQKLFDVITANVPHTQEEVWARHILLADEASANTVRQRLLNGEDFAKVAAEVSTDTGTKDKGGDLGWFAHGVMVPEFDQAAFQLPIGQISQPVKSQFGYHIIQVLARQDMPLDASAYSQAQQKAFTDWLTQARTEYKVVTNNNWQDIVPTDPAIPAASQ